MTGQTLFTRDYGHPEAIRRAGEDGLLNWDCSDQAIRWPDLFRIGFLTFQEIRRRHRVVATPAGFGIFPASTNTADRPI